MFHEGSLQSGIALAIQQRKLVACFVRDDSATSKEWEGEWLGSGWVSNLLAQKAVLLRLQAGSTEAGFLAAFSDITQVPTFIVIHNGQLQVQLKSDAKKEDFINEIRRLCGADPIPGSSTARMSTPRPDLSQSSTPEPTESTQPAETEDDLYGPSEPAIPTPPTSTTTSTSKPSASAEAKGKQKATPNPASDSKFAPRPATVTTAQQEARDALRKKKRDDAEELARIKARIEADKVARRAQAEARKAERSQNTETQQTPSSSRTTTSTRGSNAQSVALNIRLFDGRTIRSHFPRTATLEQQVRSWIDEEFAKLAPEDPNLNSKQLPPYFFRHILSPQPSRELSAGDENKELGEIELAPSATLVLVPVKGYTEAYGGDGGGGVVGTATGIVGGAFGLLSSTVGFVGSTLGSVIGYSAPVQGQTGQTGQTSGQAAAQGPAEGMRVRTLADHRAREPRQFYNGNQLSTEPRPEDDDKRS